VSNLEKAWNAVHDATPAGWHVGRPTYHDERREWVQYAFDPSDGTTAVPWRFRTI